MATELSNAPTTKRSLAALTLGAGLAIALTGCALQPVSSSTSTPSVTESAAMATPSPSASSETPSATPSSAAVDATGSFSIYAQVSDKMSGTCQTVDASPTIEVSDPTNDFYEKVDLTVVLDETKSSVVSLDGTFDTDTEGFTWKLSYDAAGPAEGTSASVAHSGQKLTISGDLETTQTRKAKTRNEVLPFKLVVKCASADW